MSSSFGMDWFEISSRASLRPLKSCRQVYRPRAAGNADCRVTGSTEMSKNQIFWRLRIPENLSDVTFVAPEDFPLSKCKAGL